MHYLDNAATSRVLPEAAEAAVRAMCEGYGNPSSLHQMGRAAARLLEDCRHTVAAAMGCLPEEACFTSCGTEATNLALRGAAHLHRHKKGHIITTAIEHAATLETVKALEQQGFRVTRLAPDGHGHITADTLAGALTEDTVLLSCQLVNNELGTVQPVAALSALLKERCPGALFHIDAVQGLARLRLTPAQWRCDLMSVSGHKIGAPKGVGALYIKKGLRLPPLTTGGGQERAIRPGTEPLPAIAAFAKACEIRMAHLDADNAHVQALAAYLRERAAAALPYSGFSVPGDVPHIQSIVVDGCKSEVMLRILSDEGVCVSAGSACSKGRQSAVLTAIGLPRAQSDCTLRVSFCPENTREDVDAFVAAVQKGAAMLRPSRPLQHHRAE